MPRKGFRVSLSYPVSENLDGLGSIETTVNESWHFLEYPAAYDAYKEAEQRLHTLGLFAQVDLIALDTGTTIRTQANLPAQGPLMHPLVAELETKMRERGQRP